MLKKKKKTEDALSLSLLKVTLQLSIQTCLIILLWDQTSSSTGQGKPLEFMSGAIKTFQLIHLSSPLTRNCFITVVHTLSLVSASSPWLYLLLVH